MRTVEVLVGLVHACPRKADATVMARSGSPHAFNDLMAAAEQSLARFDARQLSRAALENLTP